MKFMAAALIGLCSIAALAQETSDPAAQQVERQQTQPLTTRRVARSAIRRAGRNRRNRPRDECAHPADHEAPRPAGGERWRGMALARPPLPRRVAPSSRCPCSRSPASTAGAARSACMARDRKTDPALFTGRARRALERGDFVLHPRHHRSGDGPGQVRADPVFGHTLFAWLADVSKALHNFTGPVFACSCRSSSQSLSATTCRRPTTSIG